MCGLIVAILYGLFSGSRSFWDAPMALWSWVFGIQRYTRNDPGVHLWPVILGIVGFLVLRAILGLGLGASYDAERRLEPAWFELPQGSPLARA